MLFRSYSDVHLDDARSALKRLYTALQAVPSNAMTAPDWSQPHAARFQSAMNEDFGTPEAVAVLFDLASEVNRSGDPALSCLLRSLGGALRLLQQSPTAYLQGGADVDEQGIAELIAQRQSAKANKNYAEADRIRQELLAQGVVLKDGPNGTTWERA